MSHNVGCNLWFGGQNKQIVRVSGTGNVGEAGVEASVAE